MKIIQQKISFSKNFLLKWTTNTLSRSLLSQTLARGALIILFVQVTFLDNRTIYDHELESLKITSFEKQLFLKLIKDACYKIPDGSL